MVETRRMCRGLVARFLFVVFLGSFMGGCGRAPSPTTLPEDRMPTSTPGVAAPAEKGDQQMAFELTSTAFASGERIPRKYTCKGQDISPPLRWSDPPQGTRSFVLIADDPDAAARASLDYMRELLW